MKRGRGDTFLFTCLLSAVFLTAGCANEDIRKSGKPSPTAANAESPKSTVDDEVAAMRTANFRFIWVIRRKDGGVLNAADKAIIRPNTVDMNRRVVTDDGMAVIIGSNAAPFKENFDALASAFAIQDLSQKPMPSPLPTREPTPKTSKVIR